MSCGSTYFLLVPRHFVSAQMRSTKFFRAALQGDLFLYQEPIQQIQEQTRLHGLPLLQITWYGVKGYLLHIAEESMSDI
jgi:hypothetical protein